MALKNAIVQLEIRKKLYEINRPRIKYYSPMIILISDGKPGCNTGDLQIEEESLLFSKDYIAKAVAANRLISITVEIGNDCNHNLMTELTGLSADKHVAKINNNSDLNIFLKNISYVVSYGTDIDFRNE